MAQSQGDLIFMVIRTDLHCHLEVTVAQQGHFSIKSTVVQCRSSMRYGQSHRRTLIGVECFLSNGAILSDLGARVKVKPRETMCPPPVKFMFVACSGRQQRYPICFLSMKNFPLRFWPWRKFAFSEYSLFFLKI